MKDATDNASVEVPPKQKRRRIRLWQIALILLWLIAVAGGLFLYYSKRQPLSTVLANAHSAEGLPGAAQLYLPSGFQAQVFYADRKVYSCSPEKYRMHASGYEFAEGKLDYELYYSPTSAEIYLPIVKKG